MIPAITEGTGLADTNLNAVATVAANRRDSALRQLPTREEGVLKQFESVMLAMMLKQMRTSASEDGLFPGDKSDTLGGMFDTFMADHLAESGGFGITESLGQWLGRSPQNPKETATLQTELKAKAMEAYTNELSRSANF